MNRNFDYMRGELLQVLKNQDQIMENMGIKTKRLSLLENREILKLKEECPRKKNEISERKIGQSYKKQLPIVMISCNGKNMTRTKKESNFFFHLSIK